MYDLNDLNAQWYDNDNYWEKLNQMGPKLDKLIEQFNAD